MLIQGDLTIITRRGRNGDFNVGLLRLPFSSNAFVFKSSEIDQFDEGVFSGEFDVVDIRPRTRSIDGGMIFENIAVVDSFTIDGVNDEVESEPVSDVLPVEDHLETDIPDDALASLPSSDLFDDGELMPVMKLDNTRSRDHLRLQRDFLKDNGYKFDPTCQEWILQS